MGRLVESLAPSTGSRSPAGRSRRTPVAAPTWPDADVAIDFSIARRGAANLPALAARGISVVIGTTGWGAHEAAHPPRSGGARHRRRRRAELRARREPVRRDRGARRGADVAPRRVRRLDSRAASRGEEGRAVGHRAGARCEIDARLGLPCGRSMSRRRAPASIPGTHTIGFDGGGETITLTHTARDRSVFARGALEAARWVEGRRGWFTMRGCAGDLGFRVLGFRGLSGSGFRVQVQVVGRSCGTGT